MLVEIYLHTKTMINDVISKYGLLIARRLAK